MEICLLTKLGDHEEGEEGEVLPGNEALGGAVEGEQVLVVGAPDGGKEVVGDRQQRHELYNSATYVVSATCSVLGLTCLWGRG